MSLFLCTSCKDALGWRSAGRTFSTSVAVLRVGGHSRKQKLKRSPFVNKLKYVPNKPDRRPWLPQYPLAWHRRKSDAPDPALSHVAPTHWEPVRISESTFLNAARSKLHKWTDSHVGVSRLVELGIEARDAKFLITQFHKWASVQLASDSAQVFKKWYSDEFAWQMKTEADLPEMLDLMIMRRFVGWAHHMYCQKPAIAPPGLAQLSALYEAADMRYPAELFPEPRRIRRKIIMHVGPTNSGKTYNALRALAAAKRGVYAGPLRLLAHEVYTRLNTGAILPAGIERDPLDPDRLHPRACNMITGEEKRIVSEDAPLTSCTVEMLQWITHYNVAVVDEIQMIGDDKRGGAWTAAVLGLMADELHLCGEASAVPIIESLVKETGDELIVNHYERLSPLQAATSSLQGDLTKLREGDCVVAFSRKVIFRLKREIEEATPFRCAVAYGMLPPELRAEQAALFNDPNNEYGVMVASDAIGMGLNLKIKRIIFMTTAKWDGEKMVPLSLSTVKQIAGRAGRFTLGAQQTSAGIATTMQPDDLPVVQLAMRLPTRPLKRAVVSPTAEQVQKILQLLPMGTRPSAVFKILSWITRVPRMFTLFNTSEAVEHAELLESMGCGEMSVSEYWVLMHTPAPFRLVRVIEAMKQIVPSYKDKQSSDLMSLLRKIGLFPPFREASRLRKIYEAEGSTTRETRGRPPMTPYTLVELESLHRVLIMYLWLSYRLPVAFSEQPRAFELKEEVERCIAFFLREAQTVPDTKDPKPPGISSFREALPADDLGDEDFGADEEIDGDGEAEPEWMQEVNTAY